jgi:hypothetical protein
MRGKCDAGWGPPPGNIAGFSIFINEEISLVYDGGWLQ